MESDLFRYKQELIQERELSFKKLQDQENDRVQKRAENAILTEKLQVAKVEIEELKMRVAVEYTDKVNQLEL